MSAVRRYFLRSKSIFFAPTSRRETFVSSSSSQGFVGPSPYAVLQLQTSATKDEIKTAFRKLVKLYHPDLNPSIDPEVSKIKIAQIKNAYDILLDDDYGSRWGDSKVAMACDIYTLQELKMNRLYRVQGIQILYDDLRDDTTQGNEGQLRPDKNSEDSLPGASSYPVNSSNLSTESWIQISSHPQDSVSDLKRNIQLQTKVEWGLDNRTLDRDKVAKGWELVLPSNKYNSAASTLTVLSYHLFLHSYGIQHGDIIYAVIRTQEQS